MLYRQGLCEKAACDVGARATVKNVGRTRTTKHVYRVPIETHSKYTAVCVLFRPLLLSHTSSMDAG